MIWPYHFAKSYWVSACQNNNFQRLTTKERSSKMSLKPFCQITAEQYHSSYNKFPRDFDAGYSCWSGIPDKPINLFTPDKPLPIPANLINPDELDKPSTVYTLVADRSWVCTHMSPIFDDWPLFLGPSWTRITLVGGLYLDNLPMGATPSYPP